MTTLKINENEVNKTLTLKQQFVKIHKLYDNKNYSIKYLAKRIADIEYHNLPPIKVKTCRIKTKENYIPNLNLAKKFGLKAKISLDMQIKDSLNYCNGRKV